MASDYKPLGLNDQLFANDSLLARTENDYTTAQQFDAIFEGAGASNILSARVRGAIIVNDGINDRIIIGKLD